MYVYLNGTRYQVSFSTRSNLSKSSTGLLSKKIFFNTTDKVFDEARGYLYYDPTSSGWVFCGLNQISLHQTPQIMALILESPHKSEYDATGNPLRPANGKTGTCINNYLGKIIAATTPPIVNQGSIYEVHLVNAIQFQTSCYNQLSGFSDYNKNWHVIRNNVFKVLWNDGKLRDDFINRIQQLNPDLIINCVTGGENKSSLRSIVEEAVPSNQQYNHPSSWK